MSSDLAVRQDFSDEQVGLIKRTICNGATNDELSLFLNQCRRTGLDPFSRQIHAVKRGGRMTIQVGIDGFRLIAQRTGETDGQDGPFWCGADGEWKDVWLDNAKPAACKVTVYRKGQSRGYVGVARWAEFYQSAGGMWDRMPATMIAKVAESIALRKAFPQELSGLYTTDEMEQAGPADGNGHHEPEPTPPARPALPANGKPGGQHESPATEDARPLTDTGAAAAIARLMQRFAQCQTEDERAAIKADCKAARAAHRFTDEQWATLCTAAQDTQARLAEMAEAAAVAAEG